MMTVYHCTFFTYRRARIFFGELEEELRKVIDQIIAEKDYDVPSYETMPGHVHMLVLTAQHRLPVVMNMVKGISSRRMF